MENYVSTLGHSYCGTCGKEIGVKREKGTLKFLIAKETFLNNDNVYQIAMLFRFYCIDLRITIYVKMSLCTVSQKLLIYSLQLFIIKNVRWQPKNMCGDTSFFRTPLGVTRARNVNISLSVYLGVSLPISLAPNLRRTTFLISP